jgi:phosphoglycolate phosphatase-like HAD superfamily hydrolase
MRVAVGFLVLCSLLVSASAPAEDALPSWNDGPSKQAIVAFVAKVTKADGPDFVAEPERIAVFDNDGTLWAEQPNYFQAFFIEDRVRALAPQHPEWKTKEPFRSVLANDPKGLAAAGEQGLAELVGTTHSGMTTDEFAATVDQWVRSAKHPKSGRPFTEMVYQPMLELLAYLRANGFKTFIVSGGGQEFMRPWTERVYGIPPEQVVGSGGDLRYQTEGGKPALVKLPKITFIDDKAGKPVGIQRFIGRRPIFAFGNSDGDREMLEWTTAADGARFAGIVHHTDAEREWAYDRESKIGTLAKALDQGKAQGWTIVDMKAEWKTIFPPAP